MTPATPYATATWKTIAEIQRQDEFFRRAMIYWEAWQRSGLPRDLDGYYFWFIAYTDGREAALKACGA